MLMGMVTSVDARAGMITVRTRGGTTQKYHVTDETTIMRDRRRSSLKAVRKGDMVRFESDDSEGKDEPEIVRMMTRGRR